MKVYEVITTSTGQNSGVTTSLSVQGWLGVKEFVERWRASTTGHDSVAEQKSNVVGFRAED